MKERLPEVLKAAGGDGMRKLDLIEEKGFGIHGSGRLVKNEWKVIVYLRAIHVAVIEK